MPEDARLNTLPLEHEFVPTRGAGYTAMLETMRVQAPETGPEDYPPLLITGQPAENLRRYVSPAGIQQLHDELVADYGHPPETDAAYQKYAEGELADITTLLVLCAQEIKPAEAVFANTYVDPLRLFFKDEYYGTDEHTTLREKINQAAADKFRQEVPLVAALERTTPPITHEVVDERALAAAQAALHGESVDQWGTDPDAQPQWSPQRRAYYRKTNGLELDPPTKRETLVQATDAEQPEHRQHILQRLYKTTFPELAQAADLVFKKELYEGWNNAVILVPKNPDEPTIFHGVPLEGEIILNDTRHRRALFDALASQGFEEQFRANAVLSVLAYRQPSYVSGPDPGPVRGIFDNYARVEGVPAEEWMLQKALYISGEERRRAISELLIPGPDSAPQLDELAYIPDTATPMDTLLVPGAVPEEAPQELPPQAMSLLQQALLKLLTGGANMAPDTSNEVSSDRIIPANAWNAETTPHATRTEISKESLPDTTPFLSYARNAHLAGRILTALPTDPEHPYQRDIPLVDTGHALQASKGWKRLSDHFQGYDLTIPGYTAVSSQGKDGVYAPEASFDPYDIAKLTLPADRAVRIAAQLAEGGAERAGHVLSTYAQRNPGALPLGALVEALREHTTYEAGYRWIDGQSQPDLHELQGYGVTDAEGNIAGNCTVSAAILSRCLTLAGYEDTEIISGYLMNEESVSLDIGHVQVSFVAPDGKRYFADATASQAPGAEAAADAQPTHVRLPEYRKSTVQAPPMAHLREIPLTKHELEQKAEICKRLEDETLAAIDSLYVGSEGEEPLQKAIRLKLAPQDNQLLTLFRFSKQWSSGSTSGNIAGQLTHIQQLCIAAEKVQQGSGTSDQQAALTQMFGPAAKELGTVEVVRALAGKYQKAFAKLGI